MSTRLPELPAHQKAVEKSGPSGKHMAIRPREKYSPVAGEPARVWLIWLQQIPSLLYVVGGGFLIYRYWNVLHSEIVLVTGALFLAYGFYRFFLVMRTIRRQ